MGATATRITADQFSAAKVEGDRSQLIDGFLVVDEPRPIHGVLQVRLASALQRWTEEGEGRGLVVFPTDVYMDEHNVYAPDLLWIAEGHGPRDLTAKLERVPDLCVEVRSPSSWRHDVGAKKAAYERGGLPELWLVDDVAETVLLYRRSERRVPSFDVALELGGTEALTSPQLPGFSLPLGGLFRA